MLPRYSDKISSLIVTYNDSNSICFILDITVVCLNSTTQLSVVCVISIILYKYLTIFYKCIACLTPKIAQYTLSLTNIYNQMHSPYSPSFESPNIPMYEIYSWKMVIYDRKISHIILYIGSTLGNIYRKYAIVWLIMHQHCTGTIYQLISLLSYSKQKLHMIISLFGYQIISPRIYDFKHLPFSVRCRAPWPYCTLCFGNCAGQFPVGATVRSQPVIGTWTRALYPDRHVE